MEITSLGIGIGFVAGLLVVGLFVPSFNNRLHTQYRSRMAHLEDTLRDLRQERADDRETNRRLRRELAVNTIASLENTRQERDQALEELEKLSNELKGATTELADRDRSLREARLAIHDIRVHLERDRFVPHLEVLAVDGSVDSDDPALDQTVVS